MKTHTSFATIFLVGIVLILLCLPFAYAETESYKVLTTTELRFTCTLNNAIPSASATYNITINYPNGSSIVNNQDTTALGNGAFNYTLVFPETGLYKVQMFCTDGTYSYSNEGNYDITATGEDLTSAKATSYVIIFIISFIVFIGFLLIGIYLPSNNKSDELTGYIIAVSNLKYVKVLSLCFAYLTALFISYFSWMISYAYLDMDFVTNIFRILFTAQLVLILPLFIVGVYIVAANVVRDAQIGEMLSRGLHTKGD